MWKIQLHSLRSAEKNKKLFNDEFSTPIIIIFYNEKKIILEENIHPFKYDLYMLQGLILY